MTSKLSDFVRLSPLQAALVVLLGRLKVPARYLGDEGADDRIDPRLDEACAAAAALPADGQVLPYIADEAPQADDTEAAEAPSVHAVLRGRAR